MESPYTEDAISQPEEPCKQSLPCPVKMQSPKPRFGSYELSHRLSPHSSNSKLCAARSPKVTPTFCDDDSDSNKYFERNLSIKISAMAERRFHRGQEMQQLAQAQEELTRTKEQLIEVEKEKSRAFDELQEMKKVAEETNLRLTEALVAQKKAQEKWEKGKLHVFQLEQASIESAQKRDQAWQLELEANQKQHALDVEGLLAVTQELARIKQELSMAIQARNEALKIAEDARIEANLKISLNSSGYEKELSDLDEGSETGDTNELAIHTSSLVESLKLEIENTKRVKVKLAEREFQVEKLEQELEEMRSCESTVSNMLTVSRARIENLEQELEKTKESEAKTCESLQFLAKQLELTKISFEEAKLEIASLKNNNCSLDILVGQTSEKLEQELEEMRSCESTVSNMLTVSRARIENLEQELEKTKESEAKTCESLQFLAKQLELTKISFEEAKLEIASLKNNNCSLDILVGQTSETRNLTLDTHSTDSVKELNPTEHHLIQSQKDKEPILSCPGELSKEMNLLKFELKLATEAEEKSRKAMDDLVLVLKEVTIEVNQVKAKLASTEAELESSRTEVEYMNEMLRNTKEKYHNVVNEAKKEIDKVNGTSYRLKLEADESCAAWNRKELCFVQCIKKVEEEVSSEKEENKRLLESLSEAEDAAKVAKQDIIRLRDIVKQAVDEATVAKVAADIARAENSQLKDSLSDMASALERLKINEASVLENVKELKSLLLENGHLNKGEESRELKKTKSTVKEHKKVPKFPPLEFPKKPPHLNFSAELPRIPNMPKNGSASVDFDILEGSIFTTDSPKQEDNPTANKRSFHRKAKSMVQFGDLGHLNSEDEFEIDVTHFDAMPHRKKKAMLYRFGDLLKKRAYK